MNGLVIWGSHMNGWYHVCLWRMWLISLHIISCLYCIGYSCFLFLFRCLMNDIINIKFGSFIMAIVNYIFSDMSFILIPPVIFCTTSYFVCLGSYFLLIFSPSCACLSGVTVDETFTGYQQYLLVYSLDSQFFLLTSDFS